MNIRGIILAGGLSRRMGKNKLELKINGKTIIDNVIDNVKSSRLKDIIVIWGKYEVSTDLPKLYNNEYEKGMSTSIITGMKDFDGDAIMVILGDMPFVDSKIINSLIEAFENSEKNIVVPRYKGQRGNPVILGRFYFKELLMNKGDKGARDIINNNSEDVEWVEFQKDSILVDIDDEISMAEYS